MNIVIVGIGSIGYHLTKVLMQNTNHQIKLIEADHLNSIVVANKLGVPIIHGDGSKISTLAQANIKQSEILIALTGKDEDNFLCCQLAKRKFKVKTTIAKANDPKNVELMQNLAADIVISSAGMLSKIVEQQLNAITHHFITHFSMGDTVIVEFKLESNNPIIGKKISEIKWPNNTLVISIFRNGKSIVPNGESLFFENDIVIISSNEKSKKSLKKLINQKK